MIKFHNFLYQNNVYQNIEFMCMQQLGYLKFNKVSIPINDIAFSDTDYDIKLYNIDNNTLNIYYLKILNENFIYRLFELFFYHYKFYL